MDAAQESLSKTRSQWVAKCQPWAGSMVPLSSSARDVRPWWVPSAPRLSDLKMEFANTTNQEVINASKKHERMLKPGHGSLGGNGSRVGNRMFMVLKYHPQLTLSSRKRKRRFDNGESGRWHRNQASCVNCCHHMTPAGRFFKGCRISLDEMRLERHDNYVGSMHLGARCMGIFKSDKGQLVPIRQYWV